MAGDSQGNGDYQLITPPNLLKAKVGNGGAGGIDPDLVKHAESVIGTMGDEFAGSVELETARIMKLAMDLEADPAKAPKIQTKIRRISHDLRGQGATYGYDIISDVAECLYTYTDSLASSADLNADVLRAHADAMRAVVKNEVKGDGGEVGLDLVKSLEALVARMTG